MKEILAHMAMHNCKENTVDGIKNYSKLGFGSELDLRYGKNGVYLSHSISETGDLFEDVCKVLTNSKIRIALHIKELEVVEQTLELLKKYSVKNFFFVNTDYKKIPSAINEEIVIAFYANERPINVNEKILWCDEVKSEWYDKDIILNFHKQNKILYGMSKELIKPLCDKSEIKLEWERLAKLGFDGLCTNYPIECFNFLKRGGLI